jgi:predicted dehydrogenase
MMNTIKWGVLGCGNIARRFCEAFVVVDNAEVVAAASRSIDKATEFCNAHRIPKAYGSYEELLGDDSVDAVYVATPHSHHEEQVMMCFDHGKAVLCEKPLTVNGDQTRRLQLAAQEKGLFLMEAMWTRFLPTIDQLEQWLSQEVLGKVHSVNVDFSFLSNRPLESRVFNPDLAGGALLDVGIYPITLAMIVAGTTPRYIKGTAIMGETGVDVQSSYLLNFESGIIANLSAAVSFTGSKEAIITGDRGFIRIPLFWQSQTIELHLHDHKPQILDLPFLKNGFEYEIIEASDCIQNGRTESSRHPLQQTLDVMDIMDTLRNRWGLKYPFE